MAIIRSASVQQCPETSKGRRLNSEARLKLPCIYAGQKGEGGYADAPWNCPKNVQNLTFVGTPLKTGADIPKLIKLPILSW